MTFGTCARRQPPYAEIMHSRFHQWIGFAGLLIWVAVGLPVAAADLVVRPGLGWWAIYLLYGGILAVGLVPAVDRQRRLALGLLFAQLLTGLAVFALDGGYGFSSVLLVVSAVAAALLLPLRATLAVVAAQSLAMVGLRTTWGHGPTDLLPIAEAGIFAGFQLFAVTMVESGLRERRRRSELAALNVELTAAQARLTESTRAAERLRIARDMHDTLGHQLTALAVNLEVASHLVDGPAREPVEQSRLLAKQTLRDVRSAVSQMRDRPTDLDAALSGMFGTVPGLSIHLSVDPSISAGDPARDEALLRCSQEIVTNAIRHADADNVWITISQTDDAILVLGRDDGHGPHGGHLVTAGNGLRGMRERFEQLGGTVNFSAAGGFTVEAKLPAW